MSGAVISSNTSIKVSGAINLSTNLASNTSIQNVYVCPSNSYAVVTISVIPTTNGQTLDGYLRNGLATIFLSGAGLTMIQPNTFKAEPFSNPYVTPITSTSYNGGSGTGFATPGVSFVSVFVGPNQAISYQKLTSGAGVNVSISGVEFINSP